MREEWVRRYNTQARALRLMGLSVGAPNEDVEARYESMVDDLSADPSQKSRLDEVRAAYEALKPE